MKAGFVRDPTAEDYALAARTALAEKKWRLALEQAAAAVAMAPRDPSHLLLLDDAIAAARAPLALLKIPVGGAFFGLVAARGRALARHGRFDEAIQRVFDAATFRPACPFVPWCVAWVERARAAKRVEPSSLARCIVGLAEAGRDLEGDAGVVANLEAALAVAENVQRWHPPSANLLVARARLLRALGRSGEGVALLDAAGDESWGACVERAASYGAGGDGSSRVEWLERARAAHPGDAATATELGDAYLDAGDLGLAIVEYERALAIDGDTAWARISLAYARAIQERSSSPLVEDRGLDALGARARSLAANAAAYRTRLPDPVDPIVEIIRGHIASPSTPGDVRVRVRADHGVPPSARLAFALGLQRVGRRGVLACDGEAPSESLPGAAGEPAAWIVQAASMAAELPFDWRAWCERAAERARSLAAGFEVDWPDAAARLPPPPRERDAVAWVHGVQVAAALLVALGPGDRELVFDRLSSSFDGGDDWIAAAAVMGLRALGFTHGELRDRVVAALLARVPADETLPPWARAVAVAGDDLADESGRRPFVALRARIREA